MHLAPLGPVRALARALPHLIPTLPRRSPTPTSALDPLGAELAELLTARLAPKFALEPAHAVVRLSAGRSPAGDGEYTLRIDDGALTLRPGRPRRPTTTVVASPATLTAIASGTRSGVEAFLAGEVTLRGDLSLALQLDAMFAPAPGTVRPERFPRFGHVLADGVVTRYLEAGPRGGEPVVLLHGLGATNASFITTLWELSDTYRVIAPDVCGFGASSKPLRRYTPAMFARWLSAFLTGVDAPRAHLVGNSLGGRISMELALVRPEQVASLSLLAPSMALIHYRLGVPLTRLLAPQVGLTPLPVLRPMVDAVVLSLFARPSTLPRHWRLAAADEGARVLRQPYARAAFLSALREIYVEPPRGRKGFWPRLPLLSPPALFVFGDADELVPARFAGAVRRALPLADVHVLSQCGHVPQIECPEETHALIRAHLAAHPLAPGA